MKKRAAPPSAVEGNKCCNKQATDESSKKLRPTAVAPVDKERNQKPRNDYKGFSLQGKESNFQIPVEEDPSISSQDFFAKYIATRTPCIIHGLPPTTGATARILTPALLKEHAGDQQVQVEKRFSREEMFGQNRTKSRQFVTSISKFVDQLMRPDEGDLLYLSTQQPEQEEANDNESSNNSHAVFGVPCQKLLEQGLIPQVLPWAGHLILQSCNLWMGSSVHGSCSGLHHDYHDNFYLLHQGRKQFRLFSPDMADIMYTHGTVEYVHPNGLISHKGNELRADGVPRELLYETEKQQDDEGDDDEDEEEQELVLGKGFDYKSESDEEGDFDEALFQDDNSDLKDDYDDVVGDEDNSEKSSQDEGPATISQNKSGNTRQQQDEAKADDDARPDSFSRVDLPIPREKRMKDFPLFPDSVECVVDLKAGQTLYLPASWFHNVTSFAETTSGDHSNDEETDARPTHIALNYWYHPPDNLDRYVDPYQDDFWKKQQR